MNLFDQLVDEALKNQPELSSLRMVVEKELLHHDILRILSHNNLLANLIFMGGTCLRICYGGVRLSEDLDFTGGHNFTPCMLSTMSDILTKTLHHKYGLSVHVTEPIKEETNVSTWKVKIETRPQTKHLPAQCINIDICALPSYEKQPMVLLNPYGVDMGTFGLVIQAQSQEEIYADKLIAFALRPNRIKYRDLWDMVWLHQQGIKPKLSLIPQKLQDRNVSLATFFQLFAARKQSLSQDERMALGFQQEMQRFLPIKQVNETIEKHGLWAFIVYLVNNLSDQLDKVVTR